jgi:hypothetical protein
MSRAGSLGVHGACTPRSIATPAALVLADADMAQEAHVMVRVALEHTILLHWVVERAEAGVAAMLASQSENVNKSVRTMRGAKLIVPPEVEREIEQLSPGFDESEVVGHFRKVCEQLDILDLYVVYGIESAFVHPSVSTVNAYCDDKGAVGDQSSARHSSREFCSSRTLPDLGVP